MADLKYAVDIDVRGAIRALSGLKSSIAGFGSAIAGAFAFKEFGQAAMQMDDLRRTFGTLYKSIETGGAAFEDTTKLANRFGLDIAQLAQSVIKLKASGIDPTVQQLKLFADVAAVSTDKIGTLTSITDLFTRTMGGGLGLEELERLQDRGIPVYDILIDKLGKSRLELSEFGKTARGAEVIRAALSEGLNERFGGAAADRADSISAAMTRLKNAFSEAADVAGQAGLNEAISEIASTFTLWIQANQELIKALSINLAQAFKFLLENLGIITKAAGVFFAVFAVSKVLELGAAFVQLSKILIKNPILLIAVAAIAAAAKMGLLDGVMKTVNEELNKLAGVSVAPALDKIKTSADATSESLKVIGNGTVSTGARDFKNEISSLNEKLSIFRKEMSGVVNEFARQNAEQQAALELETSLIGKTSEYVALKQAEADITANTREEIAKLTQAKAKLSETELKEGRGAIIDKTIVKIQEQAQADIVATQTAIRNSEARKSSRQLEIFQIQNSIGFEDKLIDIQTKMAQVSMTAIEKKYNDITKASDASALSAIRAEEARLGRSLSTDEQAQYFAEAARYNDILTSQQQALYEKSRQFETGWSGAFKTYVEDATNAAEAAERVFAKATAGMEDLIVNFARTGKFEFKGFLNSVLEDLLRSQVRQLLAQTFSIGGGGGGGGGNFLGSLGNLLGFANGGIIPTNAPVLVGERGPELISGAAGRNVTPNNALGGLGGTSVVYNINAVDARSFKQMIAADPSFLYAVTQQGAKNVPTSRR